MIKRLPAILCVLILLAGLVPSLAYEATGETFYAYFKDARWMRTEPKANTPNVTNVPARTVLKLTPVNASYAATEYKGLTGYIHMKDFILVEYTEPDSEEAEAIEGFFGAPVRLRSQPLADTTSLELLPTDVRFRIIPVTAEYAYMTYNGQEGYVYLGDFVEMNYEKGSYEPYIAYSNEAIALYQTPCYGAAEAAVLEPYTPVVVNGYDGDHLTVLWENQTLFIPRDELTNLNDDFQVEAFEAQTGGKTSVYEYPLQNAAQTDEIQKGTNVTVTAFYGAYAYVTAGSTKGYILYSDLKSGEKLTQALEKLQEYNEKIEAQRFLNIAFTMMEEGNPVVEAYNANCGGSVTARFTYGCPYLFAGTNESSILKPRYASQDSHYYSTKKMYLGGFDCIGFARWLHSKAGMKRLPAISETKDAENLVQVSGSSAEWAGQMKVGDCINVAHASGGYHILIYIGTLRSFGFTEENVGGGLEEYLDNPLVIHCGMNNYHTDWYTQYLQEKKLTSVTPPDGGVTISILGIPLEDAPYTETMWKGTSNQKTFYWFDLQGYNLTVVNPEAETTRWYAVYRNTEK